MSVINWKNFPADTNNLYFSAMESLQNLKDLLVNFFDGRNAHATFKNAVANMPFSLLGKVPAGLPYSIWQLVEHMRITQKDILDFSKDNGKYRPMNWPAEYWPDETSPKNEAEWDRSLKEIEADQQAFIALIKKGNENTLFAPFEHGDGQSLIREALLVIDHNSYHTGQIILVRRLLHDWAS